MDSCIAVIPICIPLLMWYWNYKPLIKTKSTDTILPQSTKYSLNYMNKTRQYFAQKPTSTSPWWTGGNELNVWLTEEFFLSLKWVIKFSLKWVTSSSSYVRLFLSHFFVMSIRLHVFLRFKALIKHNDIFFLNLDIFQLLTACHEWFQSVTTLFFIVNIIFNK